MNIENLAIAQRAQIEQWRETRRESRSVGKTSVADMNETQSSFADTLCTYTGSRSLIGDLAEQAGSEMGVKADYFEQCMDQMGLSISKQTASKSENSYADSKDQTYSDLLSTINRGSGRFFGRMMRSLCDWLGL